MKVTQDPHQRHEVEVDLIAVVAAVIDNRPCVLTIQQGSALPSGPFELGHRSLQSGLRDWVEQQTGHRLGYIEQLYTFADRDRLTDELTRAISISYLGLTHDERVEEQPPRDWRSWYDYFPWEDHREGAPAIVADLILPHLTAWTEQMPGEAGETRRQRAAIAFGLDGKPWNEELVLQRYELLYEAGLVDEVHRTGEGDGTATAIPGREMIADHRRILATGIARLRTKIKYRPVVFELMPSVFTLLQLQRTVEALAGRLVHKQNFRRFIEQQELVEETGDMSAATGGRPAKLFRFRPGVLMERTAAGTKLPVIRA